MSKYYLIYFIHENYDSIIKKQKESKKKLNQLENYSKESLKELNCIFTKMGELQIITFENSYFLNPVEITRRKNGGYENISNKKKEINKLLEELDKMPKNKT